MNLRAPSLFVSSYLIALSAAGTGIRVVDDQGRPISSPLQVCFTKGLDTKCESTRPWIIPAGFEHFDSATIEGPDHGPTELTIQAADRPIVVPRKATVRIQNLPSDLHVKASIYYRDDPSFRRPTKEFEVASDMINVPAKPILLALQSAGDVAPALSLLSLKPAEAYTVQYRAATGWSLLVRCVERGGNKPVAAARLDLTGTTVATDAAPIGSAASASDGLAVFGPIALPFVGLRTHAKGFLDGSVQGVGVSKGRFYFREISFDRGGEITARVSIDGQAGVGASCQIVSMRASNKPKKGLVPESEVFGSARTDASGICKISAVREGVYLFRVLPEDGGAGTDEVVSIAEGRNLDDTVELERITIGGKVRKGDNPLTGATVIAVPASDLPNGSGRTTFPMPMMAKTNEDGEYKGVVWTSGEYSLELLPTSQLVSAADKTVYVGASGATVDFDLSDTLVRGVVTDQDGHEVAGARVVLSQTVGGDTNSRRNQSDQEGRFEYTVDGKGRFELKASKLGYRSSESVAVPVSEDAETPETTLVITKLNTITGRIVGPGGAPVPNVSVGSYSTGVPVRQGRATSDGEGRFEIERSPKGATRLFSTGSGCALRATDVDESAEEAQIDCGSDYAGVNLTLTTAPPDSRPMPDEWIWLRVSGAVIPREMMLVHCAAYGVSCVTGGDGKMTIVALSAGEYDLYRGQGASDYTITQGMKDGFLGSFSAAVDSMTDLDFEVGIGGKNLRSIAMASKGSDGSSAASR